jgi:hypothetical protein
LAQPPNPADTIEAVYKELDEAEQQSAISTVDPSTVLTRAAGREPHMIGAVVGLILLVGLLGVLFYCARMLLPLISPALQVLIILLVTIIALYVIVVLLGFVGIHVPVPGF